MAAGSIIPRILLLCLLKEVTCASVSQAAKAGYKRLDGELKQDVRGFRRPLHYVRSLRQPKNNAESLFQSSKGLISHRTLVKDLSNGQIIRQSVGHRWPQASPIQPSPLRKYPSPQPRGFQVSLDFPFEQSPSQVKASSSGLGDKPKSKSSVHFTIPQFGKKIHDGSTSGFRVNLNITPAVSMKPLQLSSPDKPKDPKPVLQTRYMEPEKLLSTLQTGLKWPTVSQTTAEEPRKHGSTWSYPDTGSKQTLLQPYVSIYTHPNKEKLSSNTDQPNNHKYPQIKLEKPLIRHNIGPQMPDSTKPPSLSIVKYLENLDFLKNPVNPTRKDNQIVPPSLQKQYLSPLQYNTGSQSLEQGVFPNIEFQGANMVKAQTNEKNRKTEFPSLHIDISFPQKTLSSNFSKSADYLDISPQSFASLFNYKPESTNLQSNLQQTKLKRPILEIDYAENKRTKEPPRGKWPNLNLDRRPQQKKWFTLSVPTKPKDVKPNFSSWFPSWQVVPTDSTSKRRVEDQKSNVVKSQLPERISKPLDLDPTLPSGKDESTSIQPKPSNAEGLQSLHSSLKPTTSNYGKGNLGPTEKVLSASTVYGNPFKSSSDLVQNVGTLSGPRYAPLTFGLSSFNSLKSEAFPVEQPQAWNKQVYVPHLEQYNSGREVPYDYTLEKVPSLYQTRNEIPQQNYGPNQNERKFPNPFDAEGRGSVFGQTYQNNWTGRDAVQVPSNVQPPCGSSSSRLGHQDYFTEYSYPNQNGRPQPCKQMPCMSPVDGCQNEPKKQSPNFPRVNYLQKAKATPVSPPSSTFQVLSQSSYHPDQNAFMLWQYPVGQRHPQQLTRSK